MAQVVQKSRFNSLKNYQFPFRLDNRVKFGLSAFLRPSSARDFRLKVTESGDEEEEAAQDEAAENSDSEVGRNNYLELLTGTMGLP